MLDVHDAGVSDAPPVVLFRRGEAFVAASRDLVGVRWTGVPSTAQLEALRSAHRLAREWGRGDVVLMNDVLRLNGSTRVERAAFDAMLQLIEGCQASTRAVAHLIEVSGPAGAATRVFLQTLERVAPPSRTRTAVFERADLASSWLESVSRSSGMHARWRGMQGLAADALAA